jgi:hypothetical protein
MPIDTSTSMRLKPRARPLSTCGLLELNLAGAIDGDRPASGFPSDRDRDRGRDGRADVRNNILCRAVREKLDDVRADDASAGKMRTGPS